MNAPILLIFLTLLKFSSSERSENYCQDCNMSKTALVILAPGADELEFATLTYVLRRAGINVTVAGFNGTEPLKCSRDVVIVPDTSLENAKTTIYDAVVLPGGIAGSKVLSASPLVGEILKQQEQEGRLVAAICAAPTVLGAHDIANGKSLTSYPTFKPQLEAKYKYIEDRKVVQDGNLITSRGPGTSFDFSLKIVEVLVSPEKAAEVAKGLLIEI